MPSAFSHAVSALAIGAAFWRPDLPLRFWVLGAVCAALPDLDALAFQFRISYDAMIGHRGLTHSLAFAAVLASVLMWVAFPAHPPPMPRGQLWLFFFLATASHGVLDAFTNGGLGVAFFAPFLNTRYFFPFRPIEVAPIGVRAFFTARGMAAFGSELVWVWLPSIVFAAVVLAVRRKLLTSSEVSVP